MARYEVEALFRQYTEAKADDGIPVSAATRSNLKYALTILPDDITAVRFVEECAEIFQDLRDRMPEMPAGSFRARRSAAADVARWAFQEGLVSHSPNRADRLGMPACFVFGNWIESPRALTAYKGLLAEMSVAGLTKADIDERFLSKFLERLPDYMADWRGGWREFRKRWQDLVEEGGLPDIDLPVPPSRKPGSYKIGVAALPEHLQEELETVRGRLMGTVLEERLGKPLDDSTVELMTGTVLRLMGYLKREVGCNLETISLRDALALGNAKALIDFTNRRWCERHGVEANEADGGIGTYEYGQLLQLASVVRIGLRDEALAAEYAEECRFAKKTVQERREAYKNIGSVDDYLGVACDLIERSRSIPTKWDISRATLVRDALIIALLATFGDRLSVMASMDLMSHVRRAADGTVLLCIPKEETKPGIRDLVREVPRELHGLLDDYLTCARPTLLGRRHDHCRLWVAQGGGALTDGAIYAMFVRHCQEHLQRHHNPHQAKKALATDYAAWSNGDYLTISAVSDSSQLTLQRYYVDLRQSQKIEDFDNQTRVSWELNEGRESA